MKATDLMYTHCRPRHQSTRFTGWIYLLVLASLGMPGNWAQTWKTGSPSDELFNQTNIVHLKIHIPPKAYDKLHSHGWAWGGPNRDRPQVQVTVEEGGSVYTNVALHLKGAAGSFQPIDLKPGLTLNFDKFAKDQTFHGLTKLSLNNSVQDPTYLTEKICREIFHAAGVPAPRADYATVELNGRKLGLFVLLEGYNRRFLKQYFHNTHGNLYDGGFLRDVDSHLSANSGKDPNDQSDLRALVAAAREPDRTLRYEKLCKVLDMDRFLSFLATEVMVCHWDGYGMNKNNYRVYHDLDTGKIVFMPHGMDQMFGVMMARADMSARPPMQGLVARALLDTSEGRKAYYERLRQLNRTIFDAAALTNRVRQLAARIDPILASISRTDAAQHDRAVDSLCERIVSRKFSLNEQLSGTLGSTVTFDDSGQALLTGWTCVTNFGKPLFAREPQPSSKTLLRISAARGSSVGSWRTKVLLEDGHYVFHARMQTKAVEADARDIRAGAGLRINGRPAPNKTKGDSDWTEIKYEFDLPDGIHDVEFVCELRASQGDVWFDASSLKVIRE